jgi:hypothetical protein
MVQRYVNQDQVNNTVNEKFFAASQDKDVAWPLLASVEDRRLAWTRDKISVMGNPGTDIGSEIFGNDNDARNAKLNAYLPPD